MTIAILLPTRMTLYRNTSDHYNLQAMPLIIKTSTKLCSQKSHHDNNGPLIIGLHEKSEIQVISNIAQTSSDYHLPFPSLVLMKNVSQPSPMIFGGRGNLSVFCLFKVRSLQFVLPLVDIIYLVSIPTSIFCLPLFLT